jgi:hypothetical protein
MYKYESFLYPLDKVIVTISIIILSCHSFSVVRPITEKHSVIANPTTVEVKEDTNGTISGMHGKGDDGDTDEEDDEDEMPDLEPYFEWCHHHSNNSSKSGISSSSSSSSVSPSSPFPCMVILCKLPWNDIILTTV